MAEMQDARHRVKARGHVIRRVTYAAIISVIMWINYFGADKYDS